MPYISESEVGINIMTSSAEGLFFGFLSRQREIIPYKAEL